jgi:hypothetical protein
MRVETYLQKIGEVDQHVVPRLFLPAGDVYADGDDVHASPPTSELVFEGKRVQTRSSQGDYFGEAEVVAYLLDLAVR